MSEVLVDTSAWIDFFRGRKPAVDRIDPLLADDRAATTAVIIAEVISGATTRTVFDQLRVRLCALPTVPIASDLWDRVAEVRFTLARRGTQAHLVDLAIAIAAADSRARLLTRDRDFTAIATVVPVDVDLF